MKRIIIPALVLAFLCAPVFSMGVVSNLKEKAKAAEQEKAAEEKEMIASADMLRNYDVLLNMEMLEGIEKKMTDGAEKGDGE